MKKTITLATMLLLGMLCSNALQADCCCSPNIVDIRHVPFHIDGTINPSNTTYCIKNNLTYIPEAGEPVAAITIDPGVHDIIIEFNNFDLYLDPSVDGIDMLGTASESIRNVTIRNGTIKSLTPSATNNGVLATNFVEVLVENMRFIDTRRGYAAPSQTDTNIDATFRSCLFDLKGVTGVGRTGIGLSTIQGLVVEDCSFLSNDPNETAGGGIGILLVNNAKNALIKRCTFDGWTTRAIGVQSVFDPDDGFFFTFPSTNIQVDDCEFVISSGADETSGMHFIGVSNVEVTNCNFNATGNTLAVLVFENNPNAAGELGTPIPSGLLVDNCTFTSTAQGNASVFPLIGYATVAVGGFELEEGINARDIIIRNSTFTHQGAPPRSDDILFVGVEGALIENCVFDSTATGRLSGCQPYTATGYVIKSANIHLGGPIASLDDTVLVGGFFVRDITIRANVICGGAQVGIYAETSIGTIPNERITIEDNSITASEEGILFENTHASTIIGNRIQGVNGNTCKKGVGIKLAGALQDNLTAVSTNNAIIDNIISNNSLGIDLECGAQGNLVKGNSVFNNNKHQIKEGKKKTNIFVDNTTFNYNNKQLDCKSGSSSSH